GLSDARLKRLPTIPTMAESGFAEFVVSGWMGVFGPAALPAAIRDRLGEALVKIGKNAELQARVRAAGIEPVGTTPAEFTRFLDAEGKKWKAFVDRTGIRLND